MSGGCIEWWDDPEVDTPGVKGFNKRYYRHVGPVDFIGPFEHHDVVVGGRVVPFLRATPVDGGRVDLTLDRRFGLLLTVAEAERILPFLAHAIAVGLGYSCHPGVDEEPNPLTPFPRLTNLIFDTDGEPSGGSFDG